MGMTPAELSQKLGPGLARTVGFDLIGGQLGQDIRLALTTALRQGAMFSGGSTPLSIFRQSLAAAIGSIHDDGRNALFLRFLRDGPYEGEGDIPLELQGKRLTDEETTTVIAFIYSHMVNCFKGAITEMLAVMPCLDILKKLQTENRLLRDARLYVGDAVWSASPNGEGFAKGADLHILTERTASKRSPAVVVGGVAEVKSYLCRSQVLSRQLEKHLARARRGLRVGKVVYSPQQIAIGSDNDGQAVRIAVLPDDWTLPRTFRFEETDGRKFLHVDEGSPPARTDKPERVGPMKWLVTLRWSKEALDAAAFGMTFWYMEKVGEALYSREKIPDEWKEMTPTQAGSNAATMMLYYAIRPFVLKGQEPQGLTLRESRQKQRAIALYNSYGFGYSLGMNFRNSDGQREMLWPADLDEILAQGRTERGCRIV